MRYDGLHPQRLSLVLWHSISWLRQWCAFRWGQSGASAENIWKDDLMKLVESCCWRWRCPSFPPHSPTQVLSWAGTSTIHDYVPAPGDRYLSHPLLTKHRQHPHPLQTSWGSHLEYQIKCFKYLKMFGPFSSISQYSSFTLLLPSSNPINI